jgi:hypothetical protein
MPRPSQVTGTSPLAQSGGCQHSHALNFGGGTLRSAHSHGGAEEESFTFWGEGCLNRLSGVGDIEDPDSAKPEILP